MEVGEQHQVASEVSVFIFKRFFHLINHFSTPYLSHIVGNGCAGITVSLIGKTASSSGSCFNKHFIPISGQLIDSGRSGSNAVFHFLNCFRNTNNHFTFLNKNEES